MLRVKMIGSPDLSHFTFYKVSSDIKSVYSDICTSVFVLYFE